MKTCSSRSVTRAFCLVSVLVLCDLGRAQTFDDYAHLRIETSFRGLAGRANNSAWIYSVFNHLNGSIVAIGTVYSAQLEGGRFALAAYTSLGVPDPNFGEGGKIMIPFPEICRPWNKIVSSGIRLSSGRFLLSGNCLLVDQSKRVGVLARTDESGKLDPAFGDQGYAIIERTHADSQVDDVTLLELPDQKFLAGFYLLGGGPEAGHYLVGRFTHDGALDESFGTDGYFLSPHSLKGFGRTGLTLLSNGLVLISASITEWLDPSPIAYRIDNNGRLDASFGNLGHAIYNKPKYSHSALHRALVLPNGKILLGGAVGKGGYFYDPLVIRTNVDGTIDPSFGAGGQLIVDWLQTAEFSRINTAGLTGVLTQTVGMDLRYLLSMGSYYPGNPFIVRVHDDGTPDRSFGTNGQVTYSLGKDSGSRFSLCAQDNGKFLVAGGKSAASGSGDPTPFALIRYDSEGRLDTGFGDNGLALTHF